eukprot:gene28504-biopygen29594
MAVQRVSFFAYISDEEWAASGIFSSLASTVPAPVRVDRGIVCDSGAACVMCGDLSACTDVDYSRTVAFTTVTAGAHRTDATVTFHLACHLPFSDHPEQDQWLLPHYVVPPDDTVGGYRQALSMPDGAQWEEAIAGGEVQPLIDQGKMEPVEELPAGEIATNTVFVLNKPWKPRDGLPPKLANKFMKSFTYQGMHFTQSTYDPCLYYIVTSVFVAFVAVYVDDFGLTCDDAFQQAFWAAFQSAFKSKNLGLMTAILQLVVDYDRWGIALSQTRQIKELMSKFKLPAKTFHNPMDVNLIIQKPEHPDFTLVTPYLSVRFMRLNQSHNSPRQTGPRRKESTTKHEGTQEGLSSFPACPSAADSEAPAACARWFTYCHALRVTRDAQGRHTVQCWDCGGPHFRRDCPGGVQSAHMAGFHPEGTPFANILAELDEAFLDPEEEVYYESCLYSYSLELGEAPPDIIPAA